MESANTHNLIACTLLYGVEFALQIPTFTVSNTYSNCNVPNSKVKLEVVPVHSKDTRESESSIASATFKYHRYFTGSFSTLLPSAQVLVKSQLVLHEAYII